MSEEIVDCAIVELQWIAECPMVPGSARMRARRALKKLIEMVEAEGIDEDLDALEEG